MNVWKSCLITSFLEHLSNFSSIGKICYGGRILYFTGAWNINMYVSGNSVEHTFTFQALLRLRVFSLHSKF